MCKTLFTFCVNVCKTDPGLNGHCPKKQFEKNDKLINRVFTLLRLKTKHLRESMRKRHKSPKGGGDIFLQMNARENIYVNVKTLISQKKKQKKKPFLYSSETATRRLNDNRCF